MKYKATFRPCSLLGELPLTLLGVLILKRSDPESYAWNTLDEALQQQLDQSSYVCPSRTHSSPAIDIPAAIMDMGKPKHDTRKLTPEIPKVVDRDTNSSSQEDDNEEVPEGSLFDHRIPGVMTKDEIEQLDLAHWKIEVRKHLVDLEVSFPCATWSLLVSHRQM